MRLDRITFYAMTDPAAAAHVYYQGGCDAIEPAPHIAKDQGFRSSAHVREHRAKVLLQAKRTNKGADFAVPVAQAKGYLYLPLMSHVAATSGK